MANQTAASAQQVLEASGEMARQVAQLSRRVGEFLTQLRAA